MNSHAIEFTHLKMYSAITFSIATDFCYQSVQFSSVAQSCPTLCNPRNCSRPGLPVHHQLQESTQIHVHCVGDAIQLFHSLSSPSYPALNISQQQGLYYHLLQNIFITSRRNSIAFRYNQSIHNDTQP